MKTQIYKWLALVAMLVSLVFVVTNATAKKPVKPPPDSDKTKAECIIFTGALETMPGWEVVEGCCPNAGPWPAYAMTLNLPLLNEDDTTTSFTHEYEGQLFIGGIGNGPRTPDAQYKVQFWSWDWDEDTPGIGDIFFQIYGGIIVEDKKNKTLAVSFRDEPQQATLWFYDEWDPDAGDGAIEVPVLPMTFDLVRKSDLTDCE